jgi:hypothetical protein
MEQRCDRRVALMVARAGLPFRQVTGREPDRIPGAVGLSFAFLKPSWCEAFIMHVRPRHRRSRCLNGCPPTLITWGRPRPFGDIHIRKPKRTEHVLLGVSTDPIRNNITLIADGTHAIERLRRRAARCRVWPTTLPRRRDDEFRGDVPDIAVL